MIATVVIYVFAISTKTIALSMLEDSDNVYDPNYAISWWNFYKHPLTAMAKSKLNIIGTEKCKRF